MKKSKMKKACTMLTLSLAGIISINGNVFASNLADKIKPLEYTDEFKKYLDLSEEEQQERIMPRMFEIEYEMVEYYNPLKSARLLGTNLETSYSLADNGVIPENVVVRNQMNTDSCWAFASLSSLETNLALKNKNNGIKAIAYDFSERHMEYATSRNFTDGVNPNSFNRTVGGGNWYISSAYLTNGTGAINEGEMPFENNENQISISEIQGKTVTSQVYDTVEFPSLKTSEITEDFIKDIKNHIKNYGSVFASIHGEGFDFDCYNNATGAIYCDGTGTEKGCPTDHAVSIIGWIDDYPIENFNEKQRPSKPGAWIIKNSWGEVYGEYDLAELKIAFFERFEEECIENGYADASMVPDEIIAQYGYKIEGDKAILPLGDDGIMYVSYEDINIYSNLNGIVKASDYTDYENVYQYNYLGYNSVLDSVEAFEAEVQTTYLGNVFNKKTNETEYLTQVGINILESCTCKVYVGTSFETIQPVTLKAGASEMLNGAGYHTLEFAEPIEVSGSFVVVVGIEDSTLVLLEASGVFTDEEGTEIKEWEYAETENKKCYISADRRTWYDLALNGDTTIKAFTTSKVDDNTLKEIKITTLPKTKYFVGENFDKTGMVVTAYYNNGRTNIIDGYSIENGTNLQLGQTSVTFKYQDKSVELPITVEENSAVSIVSKTAPTKTEYKAGENFDKTGMVIEATYKDGTSKEITDYEITDGKNLKNGQTVVTIEYQGMTTTQAITVIPNPVTGLRIQNEPAKTQYIVGQDFDKTGMIVIAIYQDGTEIELEDYIIENGTNLTKEQISVTIKFEDQTIIQSITVIEKAIVSIAVKDMPQKTQYIQNKESLDLSGGTLLVKYNDGAEETVSMTDEKITVTGFNNTELGTVQITLTYETKTVTFEVEIIKGETAENSNFDNAKCEVVKVKSYAYTDPAKEEYIIMELEVEDIVKSLKNDSLEYYYYLSANQTERDIQDWVKIQESQNNNNKLVFKVNTKDIKNYQDLISSDVLYLYIKEVAVKGGDQKVAVSKSMIVESHVGIEEYLDDVKKDPNEKPDGDKKEDDDTISKDKIPNAGKTFIIVLVVAGTMGILLISYKKYKGLKDVK